MPQICRLWLPAEYGEGSGVRVRHMLRSSLPTGMLCSLNLGCDGYAGYSSLAVYHRDSRVGKLKYLLDERYYVLLDYRQGSRGSRSLRDENKSPLAHLKTRVSLVHRDHTLPPNGRRRLICAKYASTEQCFLTQAVR